MMAKWKFIYIFGDSLARGHRCMCYVRYCSPNLNASRISSKIEVNHRLSCILPHTPTKFLKQTVDRNASGRCLVDEGRFDFNLKFEWRSVLISVNMKLFHKFRIRIIIRIIFEEDRAKGEPYLTIRDRVRHTQIRSLLQ